MFLIHYFWHSDVVPRSASLTVPDNIKSLSPAWSSPSAWWRGYRHQACFDEHSPHPSSQCQPGTTSHSPRNMPGGLQSLPGEHGQGRRLLDWFWMWEHDDYVGVTTYLYNSFVFLFFSGKHVAQSHLACINSSSQESTAEHPGGDLALCDCVTHSVIDDFYRCLLQQLWSLPCKSRTKGSVIIHVTSVFITNIKGVNRPD